MPSSTYECPKPTSEQIERMARFFREAARVYGDKSNATFAHMAIARLPDGTPRT